MFSEHLNEPSRNFLITEGLLGSEERPCSMEVVYKF